jgi:hypothetical protein
VCREGETLVGGCPDSIGVERERGSENLTRTRLEPARPRIITRDAALDLRVQDGPRRRSYGVSTRREDHDCDNDPAVLDSPEMFRETGTWTT